MTVDEALAFVDTHGVVLESAQGPVPCLVTAVVGAPVRGSWWGHPERQRIYRVTRAVRASSVVLVCRLVRGKVTLVHRRKWPAVARLVDRFPPEHLAWIREAHTEAGHHVMRETPFRDWVPPLVRFEAAALSADEAIQALGDWVSSV